MLLVVAAFAVLILVLCGFGLVMTPRFLAFARLFQTWPGVWAAAGLRLALAVSLWLAAPGSATPTAFRVLGVLTALGAVAVPIIGPERIGGIIRWGASRPPWLLRSICLAGMVLGGFLLWSSTAG